MQQKILTILVFVSFTANAEVPTKQVGNSIQDNSITEIFKIDKNWRPIGTTEFIEASLSDEIIRNYQQRLALQAHVQIEKSATLDPELDRLVAVNLKTGEIFEQIEIKPISRSYSRNISDEGINNPTLGNEVEPATEDELNFSVGNISTKSVLGSDNRNRYLNMTAYPHRTIGGIAPKGNSTSRCTGTKVGPRHVLTAGHCIHPGGGGIEVFFSNRDFAPGWKGKGNSNANKPNGHYNAIWYFAPKGWWQNNDSRYDYAVIVLENSNRLRSLGWLGTRSATVGNLVQNTVRNRGYPIWDNRCSASPIILTRLCNNFMYGMSCKGISVGSYRFSHNCDTQVGHSGSPIYKTNNLIYGVHTTGGTVFNSGVKMRSGIRNMIIEARNTFP